MMYFSTVNYEPIITTGGGIIIATITLIGTVLAALIARGNRNSKIIRRQIENDHVSSDETKIPNIRENIDHNHSLIMSKLDAISDTQRRQTNKIDKLFSITRTHDDRFDTIERERNADK